MAKGPSLRIVDRGWKRLLAAARQLEVDRGVYAKAGIIGTKAAEKHEDPEGTPLTNAQLAAIHEFGVPGRIPARPFILGTFLLHRAEYRAQLRKLVGTWYQRAANAGPMPLRQALGLLGLKMESDMRKRVIQGAGIPPPNAPSTIRKKLKKGAWNRGGAAGGQSPRPLVDTARMIGAVASTVVTGKESTKA